MIMHMQEINRTLTEFRNFLLNSRIKYIMRENQDQMWNAIIPYLNIECIVAH